MIREITMRIARTAALAAVLLLAAAGCTSRPVAGASPGGSVTIPGGAPDGGDVTVSVAECTKCHGSAARVVALSTDAKGIEIAPPPDVAGLQTGGTKIGAHLGFDEIHEGFVEAALGHKRPLTTVRDCVEGTLLAIAAEESIKRGCVVEMD